MDLATIIGLLLAWGAVVYSMFHASHGHLDSYVKPGELFLVFGGSLGAALLSMPLHNVTGVVVTEFVVDANGRIERETVGVVYSPDPLFTTAVSAALDEARFIPAMRGGHPVRQYVQLPVHFVDPQRNH